MNHWTIGNLFQFCSAGQNIHESSVSGCDVHPPWYDAADARLWEMDTRLEEVQWDEAYLQDFTDSHHF